MNKVKKKHTKCLIFPEKSIVPFFGENKTKKYNSNILCRIFSSDDKVLNIRDPPARTLSISELKSRVLKFTFLT